jgi:hypothetical protein
MLSPPPGSTVSTRPDVYSKWAPGHTGGESETIIGRWLKQSGKRGQMVIATKVGYEMSPTDKGLSRDYIFRSIEGSLKRLQTDYVDLYQSHKDDQDTPQAETLDAYAQLHQAGKGSRDRREQLQRRAACPARWKISRKNGLPRYEFASAALQSGGAGGLRAQPGAAVSA